MNVRVLAPWWAGVFLAAVTGWVVSCAPSGFQDASLIQNGVRVFAASESKPYANPGDTVTATILAYDGRSDLQRAANPEPMHVYWMPLVCENPALDAYYSCYSKVAEQFGLLGPVDGGATQGTSGDASGDSGDAQDAGVGDANADANTVGDAQGPVVSEYTFPIPTDAVIPRSGVPAYGLLMTFNMVCAGHLELLPSDPNPQALPVGCFDAAHQKLGPESYVFGFARVYAHDPNSGVTNTNPVVLSVDAPGQTLTLTGGGPSFTTPFILSRCVAGGTCAEPKIGPVVPASSWEQDQGTGLHEEIWADYYSTFGSFKAATRLLYDPTTGSAGDPSVTDAVFQPPTLGPSDPNPLTGWIWIVVHDNRGGVAWVSVPVVVQ